MSTIQHALLLGKAKKKLEDAIADIEHLAKISSLTESKSAADYFMPTLRANVNNEKLSDAEFRQFVRNSIL